MSHLPSYLNGLYSALFILSFCGTVLTEGLVDPLSGCYISRDSCPNSNVTFWLYTRASQTQPHQLDVAKPQTISQAPFVKGRPIVVLIHGYTGHKDFSPNTEIRPAYLRAGEYNIISVDYAPLVREPCYPQAVINVPVASRCTAQLLDHLVYMRQVSLQDIHVIGFSLGAHTAGMLRRFVLSGRLPRITGLDPAKPLFVGVFQNYRLNKRDAQFVDVIHTDGLLRGYWHPLGHADFYVNGGFEQPGCAEAPNQSSCNHARAPLYYAESIRYNGSTDGFWGLQCTSWTAWPLDKCYPLNSTEQALMGWHTSKTTRGLYNVPINQKAPYAKGKLAPDN